MPSFYVACKKCEKKLKRLLKKENRDCTKDDYEQFVLFETEHSFTATVAEIQEAYTCPRCHSKDCEKTFYGYGNMVMYVRGNGYLDKEGCARDMHLHKLVTDDPYANMRVPGEVEEMKAKFKRAGQHNPNTKHIVMKSGEMETAVRKAVSTPSQSTE